MESGVVALDIQQIRKQAKANQALLTQDPDDLRARIRLAWCLFAEALYDSGRNTGAPSGQEPAPDTSPDTSPDISPARNGSLADEALRHAVTAKLLSVRREDRAEAERLEELIVSMADSGAADRIRSRVYHALMALSSDVFESAVIAAPRGRRRSKAR